MCSFKTFHERRYRGAVLPDMIPGRHKVKTAVNSEPKGEPWFLPEARQRPRFGLLHDYAVTVRRRDLLDRCDMGLPGCAFQGEVDRGQRSGHDGLATVIGESGGYPSLSPATGSAVRF